MVMMVMFVSLVKGQDDAVMGKVTDAESGESLPGVNIVLKGTTTGTSTNAEGNFELDVPSLNDTLIISFIGYQTQEIALNGRTKLDIAMVPQALTGDEIVVVGYGSMKETDVTYSIARVDQNQLETRKVSRLDQALQGKLAGVRVQQSSGVPGDAPIIRIRGAGSITSGNRPLYVIDGMPVEDMGVIQNLNYNDVSSVEVLKDAAAASIYGSRGSNGVILITTKKGTRGKVSVNYSMYVGTQKAEKTVDFLSGPEWAEYVVERRNNAWVGRGGSASDPNEVRPPSYQLDPTWINSPSSVQGYDHQNWLFNSAPIQSHQLSLSGGSDRVQYYLSADFLNQDGIIRNTGFDKYGFRSNINAEVTDFIRVGLNIAPSYSEQRDVNTQGKEANIHRILLAAPVVDMHSLRWDGSDNPVPSYNLYGWQVGNSVDQILYLDDPRERSRILGNMYAEIILPQDIIFKSSLGIVYGNWKRNQFWNEAASRGNPSAEKWNEVNTSWVLENTLSYSSSVGKHNFSGLLGFTVEKGYYESSYINATGFPNDLVQTINNASEIQGWDENRQESSLLSYLGRLTYNYDSRYLVTASLRRDGSSRFGANNKWGYFPSASLGWRITEENFMDGIEPLIDELKLRASWGLTGNNQIGNYSSIALLNSHNYPIGADEQTRSGLSPATKANPDLGWEKTEALDFGIDLGVLDSRIFLSGDYYINNTSDLLLSVPVPTVSGFGSTIQNIGEVENRGYELELTTRNLVGDFTWTTRFNYSNNHNEVKKLGPNDAPIIAWGQWFDASITQVGDPIGSFYMHEQIGIWNSWEEIEANPHMEGDEPGGERLRDVNGDGVVDADDRTVVGSPMPTYTFGITNEFMYKNFDLSVFITGSGGNKIFNSIGRQLDNGASTVALYAHWDDRWRSESDPGNGKTPKADVATRANSTASTRWLYDGDYFRIQNVTLGYTFPKDLVGKFNIANLRIYASGENLYLHDQYPVGYNPEVSLGGESVVSAGEDYGIYPLTTRFIVGLSIGF